MITVILVIHIMLAIALVGIILLQKSEGGAFGMGGSSSSSFMTGRQAGNVLTKGTTILAVLFFATSLTLAILVNNQSRQTHSSILDEVVSDQNVLENQMTEGENQNLEQPAPKKQPSVPLP